MVIVGHLVSFIMGKCQRQMRSAWITPASVWSYRFPDSLVIARRQRRDDQGGGEMGRKMHAGEAGKGRGQRANGGKISAITVETSKLAGKREEKCTPAGSLPNICRGRMILFPTAPFFRDIILKNQRYFQSSRRRTSSVNAILWA